MKVVGAVLAAGRSTRMGRPKALLPAGDGLTFVGRLVTTLHAAGLAEILVVVRDDDALVPLELDALALASTVRLVVNQAADVSGQLSSVQTAVQVARASGADGLLVVPVDLPLIRVATVARLIQVFETGAVPIVRASHGGRHGHPVIFARALYEELMSADPAVGARAVVRAHGAMDVEVPDPAVVLDVDTPEDYDQMFGRGAFSGLPSTDP